MPITSGKTPHSSQKKTPQTKGLRMTENERGDQTEWNMQWEVMKEREREIM